MNMKTDDEVWNEAIKTLRYIKPLQDYDEMDYKVETKLRALWEKVNEIIDKLNNQERYKLL
jgi:hypothetical protein